jgi:cysteine desulfurase / selenocysteine lyase
VSLPKNVRDLFPATKSLAYLNHSAVSPPSLRVRDAVLAVVDDLGARGVGAAIDQEAIMEETRAFLAGFIGAEVEELAFVTNTSHALSLIAEGVGFQPGDEIAVCETEEYPSNVYPWQRLARERGVILRSIRSVRGGVTLDALREVLSPRTRLVAASSVQYATGAVTDIEAVGALCRERGILFAVDVIQSLGVRPLDVHAACVDFAAAGSHKWTLGLPGSGVFFVRKALIPTLRPALVGWRGTQTPFDFDNVDATLADTAKRFEEGNLSLTGIAALGAGLRLIDEVGKEVVRARVTALLDDLEERLRGLGCDVSPGPGERAGILTFASPRVPADELFALLDARGVALSVRRGRVRVAPHFYNDSTDLDRLLSVVREAHRGA